MMQISIKIRESKNRLNIFYTNITDGLITILRKQSLKAKYVLENSSWNK
jgi:hypothetical protein